MDARYYFKSLLKGLLYYVVEMVVWFWNNSFTTMQNTVLVGLATLSLFLFPFSKLILKELALSIFSEKFLYKWIIGNDVSTPKITALSSLICMLLAIPLGLGYLIYFGLFGREAS